MSGDFQKELQRKVEQLSSEKQSLEETVGGERNKREDAETKLR